MGVEGVLYDLDDTLIYTAEIFHLYMDLYADMVADQAGIDRESFFKRLSDINDEEYKTMGVSPLRWDSVVMRLASEYPEIGVVIVSQLNVLKRIYRHEPRKREGANAILDGVRRMGLKQGLVTHANVEWTNWKMDTLGWWGMFDGLYIADENGFKTKKDWARAMEILELDPRKCIVVGDNLSGDVIPTAELGARTMWMPSPWSVYRAGVVPESTIQIGGISEFYDGIMRMK